MYSIVNRWPAKSIHGDKSQQERDYVLSGMKTLVFFGVVLLVYPLKSWAPSCLW
jgi:hypothetical protein